MNFEEKCQQKLMKAIIKGETFRKLRKQKYFEKWNISLIIDKLQRKILEQKNEINKIMEKNIIFNQINTDNRVYFIRIKVT